MFPQDLFDQSQRIMDNISGHHDQATALIKVRGPCGAILALPAGIKLICNPQCMRLRAGLKNV